MKDLQEEAAKRGVSVGFLRAEHAQNLRKQLFGDAARLKATINKETLAKVGAVYWPLTYGKAPTYEGAVESLVQQVRDLAPSADTSPDVQMQVWSIVEALEVPDAHLQLMGSCRWVDQGLPVVQLGEKYAAALMSTSVPKEILQDVRPPWRAFLIEIPPVGLVIHGDEGEVGEIRRVLVWVEPKATSPGEDGWAYLTMCPDKPLTLWFIDNLQKLAEPDSVVDSEWDALPFGLPQDDRDKRVRTLIARLILNTCLAMSNPANLKSLGGVHKTAWTSPSKRFLKDPVFRHFRLGTPISVDCREAVRDYVEGSRKRTLNVQTMVRGHWKNQPHGPKAALRKLIWVEPYWKGPEEGPVLVRPHQVQAVL